MHHFFADPTQVAEDTIFITGPDVNHMKHVLRMKPGEEVLISDGTGRDYTCEVEAFEPDRAVAVSYTHLDVYKRQGKKRDFRGWGRACRI